MAHQFDASKLTSVSLLDRLKSAEPDDPQWRRLHDIYEPWILRWLARVPELRDEAHDLTQEVLLVVVRELPQFQRQRDGSFRRWLGNVLVNRLRSHWKQRKRRPLVGIDSDSVDGFLQQFADPASALSRQWDEEHDQFVLQRLMATSSAISTPRRGRHSAAPRSARSRRLPSPPTWESRSTPC